MVPVNSPRRSDVTSPVRPRQLAHAPARTTKRGVMRTFGKIAVVAGIVAYALLASGRLSMQVHWLDNEAHALDLFGKKGEAAQEPAAPATDPFWQQGTGKPPVVPRG